MRNVCLIVEYVGTKYCGFQRQKNGLSVQEVLENAIFEAIRERVKIYPSGRTDAGVHALGQTINFFTNSNVPANKFCYILKQFLPNDVRIINGFEVDENFNSRKSAISKSYVYKMYMGKSLSVFDVDRCLLVDEDLDIKKMNISAMKLIGEHDFSSFCSIKTTAKTTIRTIFQAYFEKIDNYLYFTISGNGFLYNMVRIILGTLLEIGKGKRPIEDIDLLLLNHNRTLAGKTVKPDGLYLKEVKYKI